MTLPLFGLFMATFEIATSVFTTVGLLPGIASTLNVSIPEAGLLVTAYAVGVAAGGPIITILAAPLPRKMTLLLLMVVFVVGHILSAAAPTYAMLIVARVIASVCHASFLGIAAVVASSAASAGREARAVSMVWLGFSAGSLVGVPGGTALGHTCGWRATFWAIALVGAAAAAAIAIWV